MKKGALTLFKEYPLPAEPTVTETFGFLGKKGGGKTYAAQRLLELLYGKEVQCIVLDPVGNWRGLRIDADGKSPGLDVPVFGGPHGDIPLEVEAGKLVAQVVVETGTSVILDVSRFRKGERKRFMTDFAEEFFHRKKDSISPVHLFVEEAHMFVPQRVQKGEERMLGAMEDIVRVGRNYGIGVSLISQRAASVNKDVLTQVECLLAFQTSSSQDKKALRDWVEENDDEAVALLNDLKSLHKGEALFWSPSFMRRFDKVHVTEKNTFNLSQTPTSVEKHALQRKLGKLDLAEIEGRMRESIERQKDNDPTALRQQVKELKAALMKAVANNKPVTTQKSLITDVQIARMDAQCVAMQKVIEDFESAHAEMAATVITMKRMVDAAHQVRAAERPLPGVKLPPIEDEIKRVDKAIKQAGDGWKPPGGARAVLAAVFLYGAETKEKIAIRALTTASSGTFNTYLSRLVSHDYLERDGAMFKLTSYGRRQTEHNPYPLPPPGEQLVRAWCGQVNGKAKDILRAVVGRWPVGVSKKDVAAMVGMTITSGTFNTYLSRLRSKGLIFPSHDKESMVAASELLES